MVMHKMVKIVEEIVSNVLSIYSSMQKKSLKFEKEKVYIV